jgi:hypothetical protein
MVPAQTSGNLFGRPASSKEAFHAAGSWGRRSSLKALGRRSLMGAVVGDATPVPAQTSVSPDVPGYR